MIGKNEKIRIARRQKFIASGGHFDLAVFFVDHIKKTGFQCGQLVRQGRIVHPVVISVEFFAQTGILQHFFQRPEAGRRQPDLQEQLQSAARIRMIAQFGGRLLKQARRQGLLGIHQFLHHRLEAVELIERNLLLSGDNQGSPRLVDQHAVDFIDDGKVEFPLDHFFPRRRHAVIAQIIESEFAVDAIGDIAKIGFTAFFRRLSGLDAADGHAEKAENAADPLGIPPGQIIVDRNQMRAPAAQRIQIQRHGGGEGFAFAGRHFGDPVPVQDDSRKNLFVERNHIPRRCNSANVKRGAAQSATGVFYYRECLHQQMVEGFSRGQPLAEFGRFGLQLGIRQRLQLQFGFIDPADRRTQPEQSAFGSGPQQIGIELFPEFHNIPHGFSEPDACRPAPAMNRFR
ncbi:hypothetical protein SDC9_128418 [bioreactor metagenome]|uniref:Uncharacterized protein n=1 Tax=bioreactor metagenome TaxID=1076179 RepID=A0A645CWY2_9ZZZZ